MPAHAAPVLESVSGELLALSHVHINACLHDLIGVVTLEQGYVNTEGQAIEAVYTFPLPLDALLLSMEVELNDRTLKGRVFEKATAEEEYEEAVSSGDGAFMLQQPEPGLYTMNVGNIRPGEKLAVRIRFSLLNRWQGDSLRVCLPTCIAPRYGDPEGAGLQPHQVPEYTFSGTAPLAMELVVSGLLVESVISSPTHRLSIQKDGGQLRLTLAEPRAMLDRDVVLVLRKPGGETATALIQEDLDGHAVLASFNPRVSLEQPRPAALKLLVDCSGSMGGMSMAQAREGARRVVQALRPGDLFSITAFGSMFRHFSERMTPASPATIEQALSFIDRLDADLGGTELFAALDGVYGLGTPEGMGVDILLITDGEVYGAAGEFRKAERSGHRIMTVGVGLSAAESVVRRLSDLTGGACEIVTPNEDMAERILRQFKRVRLPKTVEVGLEWPANPQEQAPRVIGTIFDGDTLHVCARFTGRVEGEVELKALFENGQVVRQRCRILQAPGLLASDDPELPGIVARIAAQAMRSEAPAERGLELALRYQLMGEDTSYLAVDVRPDAEKSEGLPALRKVPQMVAAGWGGLGSVANVSCSYASYAPCSPRAAEMHSSPLYMRWMPDPFEVDFDLFVAALSARYPDNRPHDRVELALDDLPAMGFGPDAVEEFSRRAERHGEDLVIGALLKLALQSRAGKRMSRTLRRLVRKSIESMEKSEEFKAVHAVLKARIQQEKSLLGKLFGRTAGSAGSF
jgi:Ca-activated chloride channel homolog